MKRNVDEELDSMRKNYHGLDVFLSEIAKEISVTIPSDFTSIINVIYFPQLGYLITVPKNPEWNSEEDYKLEGLTVQVCNFNFEGHGCSDWRYYVAYVLTILDSFLFLWFYHAPVQYGEYRLLQERDNAR